MSKSLNALEVQWEKLRRICNPDVFDWETTADLKPLKGIIGQYRGEQAIDFGLKVRKQGYNIFVAGQAGTGKMSYVRSVAENIAATQKVPDDWCYVYNLETPSQPRAINLPAGWGYRLRQDMSELVNELLREIPRVFESEEFEKRKNAVLKEFQEKNAMLLEELNRYARERGFILKRTSSGFTTIPVVQGKALSQEEYERLDQKTRDELEKKSSEVQFQSLKVFRQIKLIEKKAREKVKELEKEEGLSVVGHLIDDLLDRYRRFEKVVAYLEDVKKDILANLDYFSKDADDEEPVLPWAGHIKSNTLQRYKVNLLVDNRNTRGAPVIIESNPNFYNLVGRIEHKNEWGVLSTNFLMIKSGAFHRANGGYLILRAKDVLSYPESWQALKRILYNQEVKLENLGEQYGMITLSTSKPQPIPVDVKVIIIGSPYIYHLLFNYDEDFEKHFKIKADFDTEMEYNTDNIHKLACFISSLCSRENLRNFSRDGVAKIVEYSSEVAENSKKLTTRFDKIIKIIYEADAWAEIEKASIITGEHVLKAISQIKYRSNMYEEKMQEMVNEGKILLETEGWVVGQVNALSVIDTGDYYFGRPCRITATTCIGEQGVINIEREIRLSGRIHSKGVLILSGYLGAKYAQKFPLSVNGSLCFEQQYGGIDGDSASSAELYALLSSLADLPINQAIAVTGSVDQKGNVQAVGGVTAKIEGFYNTCKLKKLTGEQGVIIPKQNIDELMLKEEVVEAVRSGKFHIYAVENVDQGIEILTGRPAGKERKDGTYPRGSVHYLVTEKLKYYTEKLASLSQDSDKKA